MTKKIVVVGGGTAGWITALFVDSFFRSKNLDVDVTLIEPNRNKPIGVGEATTSAFSFFLDFVGISKIEFLKETKATFKYGILHKNWSSDFCSYYGPTDDPHFFIPTEKDGFEFLNAYPVSIGESVANHHLYTKMMKLNLSPYYISGKDIKKSNPYIEGYHFDNFKLSSFLKRKSKNVRLFNGSVKDVCFNEKGFIKNLVLNDNSEIYGDLFFDCTGFKKVISSKIEGFKLIDIKKHSKLNRAIAFQKENKYKNLTYTKATALKNGWVWETPTQERIGSGYVYSDEFCNREEAKIELDNFLGYNLENFEEIEFSPFIQKKPWNKNCVSLGLSCCFIEPLESTSIHSLITNCFEFLNTNKLQEEFFEEKNINKYNKIIVGQQFDFLDFINMHYQGGRKDSNFWKYMNNEGITVRNKEIINLSKTKFPSKDDFLRIGINSVSTELFIPVLDGLKIFDKKAVNKKISELNIKNKIYKTFNEINLAHEEILKKSIESKSFFSSFL
tara:strand:- start:356 stop:1858 length:1503 start_codon:yes stop_codon:yes gene_type:complete